MNEMEVKQHIADVRKIQFHRVKFQLSHRTVCSRIGIDGLQVGAQGVPGLNGTELFEQLNNHTTDIGARVAWKLATSRGLYETPSIYLNGFRMGLVRTLQLSILSQPSCLLSTQVASPHSLRFC